MSIYKPKVHFLKRSIARTNCGRAAGKTECHTDERSKVTCKKCLVDIEFWDDYYKKNGKVGG